MPADLRKSGSWHDRQFDLDYVTYQQYAAPLAPLVDGAQVTVVSRNGKQLIVGGAYYPGLRSTEPPQLTAAQAVALASDLRGGLSSLPDAVRGLATRRSGLRLDPESGRLFYLVATAAPGNNGYQEIDAQNGTLLAAWGGVDQISAGQGVGVKGDTKTLSTSPFGDLTSIVSGHRVLKSTNGNFITYNAGGGSSISGNQVMSDATLGDDDKWSDPTQAAGVDAQYYAALTVQFYSQELGYDWLNDCIVDNPHGTLAWPSEVRSVVHYDNTPNSVPYNNAFWDEQLFYMVYGDGSTVDRPLSAGQDVVSHELSHAVTQCNSNLAYQYQSGALNESFSDIMATAAEFIMEEPNSSNCWRRQGQTGCADWLIGEDLAKTASGAVIRNLADPESEGQPSHFEDRVAQSCSASSSNDYCGVHTNSGIPNHAFYLLANGGRNARCSGPSDPKDDCDVMVPPTTVDHATKIFFSGFKTLTSNATMCDARNSTIAAATVLYPSSVTDIAATILAWQAVGLGDNCDGSITPPAAFTISLSTPTIPLASGNTGSSQLSLDRNTDNTIISFSVDEVGPATVGLSPASNPPNDSSGAQINVTADGNAADGIYPVLVTATGQAQTHYTALSMVIDAEPPSAAVTGVGFVAMATVTTGGSIPLSITWTATDGESGIASKELDHSPNGSGWVSIGTTSPTTYPATFGPHQFQVVATDGVGNDTTSAAFIRSLSAFQETGNGVVYTGTWSTNSQATPWGTTKYSIKRRATATLTFTGNAVVWIAQRGPKRGVANVFVDGVKTHVDLYSSTLAERRVVFMATNLSASQHTITIKVKATYHRPRVDVDGFFVLN
ncbi:MAG: M4 family metallopeptidase [Chloroflexota bacterium]